MIDSPVAYFIFNRPEHTKKTFAAIREQRPLKLFIVADGPRPEIVSDQQRCSMVREVVDFIDWPCEVYRNYSDENLGLKRRISSGLDWVFEHVDRAIILEDDCLAHSDFFRYCDQLLERFAEDQRVSVITGNNFQNGAVRSEASYYFSKYCHCWGWATWRRAWSHYDRNLTFWPEWKKSTGWISLMQDASERKYWENIFEEVLAGKIDTWDYQWMGSVWKHGGLTATPNVNLVSNIGFGPDATHTVSVLNSSASMITLPLGRLSHCDVVKSNSRADKYVFRSHFLGHGSRLGKLTAHPVIWFLKSSYLFVKSFLSIKKVR